MKKIDPFTRTPGIAGKAYIDTGVADEIINNFLSADSSKYVYKITGLRGSGKSVEYGKIIRTLKDTKNWLVYPLSASGDTVSTLISKLGMEKFIDSKSVVTTISSDTSVDLFSAEAALTRMIELANKKKYNVLIGIDDISKTGSTVELLSIIGSMILEGCRIYLVVTGLSENIEEFSSVANLTFFKRADTIEMKSLNKFDIKYMYEKLLKVDSDEAKRMEELTKGYAYAYQVLGSLYFCKKESETLDDIIPDFERILFRDSYDLIWQSLTPVEKEVVKCIYKTKNGKAEDIKALMKKPSNYTVYRERLINKHLVNTKERGFLQINLPLFDRFIEIWGN